ncbi:Ser/Thr protein phosphatase family protein [Ascosphaera apis ARSEF 7405]|uniref:Ser/Thr protein phosphatase family protein n=1 Tax=Ascosphaera apis ARSEF 7405 TaxID=392613 RepID=A0A167VEN3_9EURO|nr:Ser/Thr protein phosphatase family protein [Ascosphaera apis ARSEF 7405]
MKFFYQVQYLTLALGITAIEACGGHSHPTRPPPSRGPGQFPKHPLEWGQLNFLHTTDIHGFFGGHRHGSGFNADWGDFASFVSHMRDKANDVDVDLLLIDTGDLHDGNGLSDATDPDGRLTNGFFERIDYDLLTIGNHELMSEQIAYQTKGFAQKWGDKYLTTNVQIKNNETGEEEYIGSRYRYFTTKKGLRVMAFGIYGDNYTSQADIVNITSADTLIQSDWWTEHVEKYPKPIDMFIILTHQPFKPSPDIQDPSMWKILADIRARQPDTPVQFFGGHTHVRDFAVLDEMSTGIESGAFAETVGWVSISGLKIPTYHAAASLGGLPQPTRRAKATKKAFSLKKPKYNLRYSRRYLDWDLNTFKYHSRAFGKSVDDQNDKNFDTNQGKQISRDIAAARKTLKLDEVLGCVPKDYCFDCADSNSNKSVFSLWRHAVSEVVVNRNRANFTRYIITTGIGGASADILKGDFTRDDSYIAYSGPAQKFYYLGGLPKVIAEAFAASSNLLSSMTGTTANDQALNKRDPQLHQTIDDFGSDGDDTPHHETGQIYAPPEALISLGGPAGLSTDTVDVVIVELAIPVMINILSNAGIHLTRDNFKLYMDGFTTKDVWPKYASQYWQKDVAGCTMKGH